METTMSGVANRNFIQLVDLQNSAWVYKDKNKNKKIYTVTLTYIREVKDKYWYQKETF